MKSLKTTLCLLLCLLLALSCAACGRSAILSEGALSVGGGASTREDPSAGTEGPEAEHVSDDGLRWSLRDGVLTISGEGPMADYDDADRKAPWREYGMQIRTVVVEEGVTAVGAYAFAHCVNLSEAEIPDSVSAIGAYAFLDCAPALYRNTVAVSVGGKDYSPARIGYLRANARSSLNLGGYSLDYNTVAQYFGEETANQLLEDTVSGRMLRDAVLLQYAGENGLSLSPYEEQLVADSAAAVIKAIEEAAANYQVSPSKYMSAMVGPGVDEDLIRTALEEDALANKALFSAYTALRYGEEELTAYYGDPTDGDIYSYAFFLVQTDQVGGAAEARSAAEAVVMSFKDCYDGEVEPETALSDILSEEFPGETPTVRTGVLGTGVDAYFLPWLNEESRAGGDITAIEAPDDRGWYVLLFLDHTDNTEPVAAVRHILIKAEADEDGVYTDEAKAAAKARAEEILAAFNETDRSEASFAVLAYLLSEDTGSRGSGGLYSQVKQGQMVPEFDAFCFADHAYGDTAVIYGEGAGYAGYHVMFFVEKLPAREAAARDALRSIALTDWSAELTEGIEPVVHWAAVLQMEDGAVWRKPAAPTEADLHHVEITIRDYGVVTLELDATAAPVTVQNFLNLAQSGFYDGLTFHRIMDGFMIQGGDPKGDGTGGSGRNIQGEFSSNGWDNPISHKKGVISMARARDLNSASSQFFICVADSEYLDGQYAAFGHVTEGMEILEQIARDARPIDNNGTIPADQQPVIESIRVLD